MKHIDDNYRYERKFVISALTPHEVETELASHPAMFGEIYHQRFVNNIYFDSIGFRSYLDNLDGLTARRKIRIRWYGDLFGRIGAPVLECKIKRDLLGRKESYPLRAFTLDTNCDIRVLLESLDGAELPPALREQLLVVRPVLLNRYSRKYFRSADGNFRVTIDTDLASYQIDSYNNLFLHKTPYDHHVILELKYNSNVSDEADLIATLFPFRITKSSKYVGGIEELSVRL